MKKDFITLALRNLTRRPLRTILTIIGIFIGIAAVVSLISVGEGLKLAVSSQFGIGSTQVITVQAGGINGFGPPGSGVVNPLTKDDAKAMERISSVKAAIPRNIESIRMDYNDKLVIGFVATIPDDKENRDLIYELLDLKLKSGDLIEDTSPKVILGNDFSFSDKSGFDKAVKTGDEIIINGENFEVAGILEKKGSFIIDGSVLMSDTRLDDLTDFGESADIIAVVVKDKSLMEQAKEDIEKLLRDRRDVKKGEEDFEVSTPESSLAQVNQVLTGVQIFIVIIASISIVVGIVGIVNTMMTSVLERRKEIGIMKSIGAKNSDIFYQFFIESGLLGLIGGLLGVIAGEAMGYFGTLAINNFIGTQNTPQINFPLIIFALIGSFVVGALSGIIPALRAAKLSPIQALRS